MADSNTEKKNTMTGFSAIEIIRPVSYTGPLMPRPVIPAENSVTEIPVAEKQPSILIPDFSEYFQKFVDSIFQRTKEEPKLENSAITEKTATAEFSEKKKNTDTYNSILKFRMKSDPYNKLMYDQCILEGCTPEMCANKYFPEMS